MIDRATVLILGPLMLSGLLVEALFALVRR